MKVLSSQKQGVQYNVIARATGLWRSDSKGNHGSLRHEVSRNDGEGNLQSLNVARQMAKSVLLSEQISVQITPLRIQ